MVRSDLCVFIFATRNPEPAIIRRPLLTPRFVIAEYGIRNTAQIVLPDHEGPGSYEGHEARNSFVELEAR